MNNISLCRSIAKKLLSSALIASPLLLNTVMAQGNEGLVADKVLTNNDVEQQPASKKEMETQADTYRMQASKLASAKDYQGSIKLFYTVLDLYRKVSMTDAKLVNKTAKVERTLAKVFKLYAEKLIVLSAVEDERENLEKATQALNKALFYDKSMDMYVTNRKIALKERIKKARFYETSGLKAIDDKSAALTREKEWRYEQAMILMSHFRFADAKELLSEVLVLDLFDNKAASMIKRINQKINRSGSLRREATVIDRVSAIEWKWSLPVITDTVSSVRELSDEGIIPIAEELDEIYEKLAIVIPRFKMEGESIEELIEQLKKLIKKNDPSGKGLTIIHKQPRAQDVNSLPVSEDKLPIEELEGDDAFPEEAVKVVKSTSVKNTGKTYDFDFENMPVEAIVRYVCQSAGLKYRIEQNALVIAGEGVSIEDLVIRFYPVKSSVFGDVSGSTSELKSYLQALGIEFGENATVNYVKASSRLVLKNTVLMQNRIQEVIKEISVETAQVIIEAKVVEISQTELDELGVKWQLTDAASNGHFSLLPTTKSLVPSSPKSATNDIVPTINSASLRSGIRNLGSLIDSTISSSSQIAANLTVGPNKFNLLINALSQVENKDILIAPKIFASSGETAVLRIVREQYFPESWEKPDTEGSSGGGGTNNSTSVSISPSVPEFGEATELGTVIEVTPQIDQDGVTIELDLRLEITDLIRMDDSYNGIAVSDTSSGTSSGSSSSATSVDVNFDTPIIGTRSIETSVKIWDGETILVGGLTQEKVISVNDRVPYLADLPLIGGLFRNKGEQRVKNNILIFVSARLIDNAGLPLRENEVRGLPDFKRL
ncbi:MAG: hypothetical protein HRT88_10260 [Lentisphaeraceae bacterium]|nr:hypothetical protein [Lentisphaeraceae bacterium]